jgi:hypothetical protein
MVAVVLDSDCLNGVAGKVGVDSGICQETFLVEFAVPSRTAPSIRVHASHLDPSFRSTESNPECCLTRFKIRVAF